jgi:predicted kinase
MKKPLLIATLGYPGSGKTYFSERFSKEFGFAHVNSDKVRSEMIENPTFAPKEMKRVFGFIHWVVEEFLKKGVSVIVDANLPRRIHRNAFAKSAKKCRADFIMLHVLTPVELAEKRLIKRKEVKSVHKKKYYRPLDISVLHLIKDGTEASHSKEPVITIDGTKPYAVELKEFKSKLKYKLSP